MTRRVLYVVMGAIMLITAPLANAELTIQGWLDFYDGKSEMPAVISRVMASSYVLGVADSAISLRVMSCPKDYIPEAGALSAQTADVLRNFRDHRGLSVTAAVLVALSVGGGCVDASKGKAQ